MIKKLGLHPRRTIRLVLWTSEENGIFGGEAYAQAHAAEAANHVFALESDSGIFDPASMGFSGSDDARAIMTRVMSLIEPLGLPALRPSGGGADIGPIARAGNVPTMSYDGDSTKYFTIHHSPADTIDRIAKAEVAKAAAAIAVVTYVVADMPERLPR